MATQTKTLTAGEIYNIDTLKFAGWSNGEENPGYNCWDYFDGEGKYLGADDYGIEPVFEGQVNGGLASDDVDLSQGKTEGDREFGYVHGDEGGFFFTWMDSLESTLESIDEDDQDGDGGLSEGDVRAFLANYLPNTSKGRAMWMEVE